MGQKQIRTGSPVSWDWGNGTAEGKVQEIHREEITKKIKGNQVTDTVGEFKNLPSGDR